MGSERGEVCEEVDGAEKGVGPGRLYGVGVHSACCTTAFSESVNC